jgi:hypothetical protein
MARKKVSRRRKTCQHCCPEGARLVKWANEWADGADEELLLANGFEEAIIGVTHGYSSNKIIYDYDKCIEILMRDMSEEDALEHMGFNVTGAYVGDHTPIFIKLADNNGA